MTAGSQFHRWTTMRVVGFPWVMRLLLLTSARGQTPRNSSLCQSFSCNGPDGTLACPDNAIQSRKVTGSAGGNVFVTIIEAKGYRDRDGKAIPDAGVARRSDPYVRVKVGTDGHWSTKETSRAGKGEEARWGETLSLGWHRTGEAQMLLEVLDYDRGLELLDGGDDSLGSTSLWLPFCSMLTTRADCIDNACQGGWQDRKLCREEGWLLLNDDHYTAGTAQACCENIHAACLHIAIEIVPFQIYVDAIYIANNEQQALEPRVKFAVSLFVDPSTENAGSLPAVGFGQPYVDRQTMKINGATSPLDANGALLLQTTSQIYEPKSDLPPQYAGLSMNAAATLTLCRPASCRTFPGWLQEWDYVTPVQVAENTSYMGYACYRRAIGLAKYDEYYTVDLGWPWCKTNYFIVVEPHLGSNSRSPWRYSDFPRIAFLIKLIQFGVPLLILLARGFRIDHVLVQDTATHVDSRGLRSSLFLADGATASNVEFRHNYYWSSRSMFFLLGMPCTIFWACGIVLFTEVKPKNIGLCTLLIGTAVIALLRAIFQWRHERWHLTRPSCINVIFGSGCALMFSLLAPFHDTRKFNFIAFTMASLTINLVPLALGTIEFSSSICHAKESIALAVAAASAQIEQTGGSSHEPYWLFKECYSASSQSSHFDLAPDVAGNLCGLNNQVDSAEMAALRRGLLRTASRLTLVVYVVAAFISTSKGFLGLAIATFLIFMDVVNCCLDSNTHQWSPLTIMLLATVVRVAMVLGGVRLWLVGFSVAYSTHGFLISWELVNRYLPCLNHLESCGHVFHVRSARRNTGRSSHFDVASQPEFALATMTVVLFAILLIAGYAEPAGVPLPNVKLTSNVQFSAHVCPVIAVLLVAFCGAAQGFLRASYLDAQHMLTGHTVSVFLIVRWFNLPKILLSFSYACLVITGLLLWGETHKPVVLIVLAFGPLCIHCGFRSSSAWFTNECRLINWPPSLRDSHTVHDDVCRAFLSTIDANTKAPSSLQTPQLVRHSRKEELECLSSIALPTLLPKSIVGHRASAAESYQDCTRRPWTIDLGLHTLRVNKYKNLLSRQTTKKESNSQHRRRREILPHLTIKEVWNHLAVQCYVGYFSTGLAKVAGSDASVAAAAGAQLFDPGWHYLPLWEALFCGCLFRGEYEVLICVVVTPFFFMVLGASLALYSQCVFSHLLWIISACIFLHIYPILKWFKLCKITRDMVYAGACGCVLYFVLLVLALLAWLDARIDAIKTLWVLDAAILYPLNLASFYWLIYWIDRGCKVADPVLPDLTSLSVLTIGKRLHDPCKKCLRHTLYGTIYIFFSAQIYLWCSRYAGLICCTLLFSSWVLWWLVGTWAKNEFYLPQKLMRTSRLMIIKGSIISTLAFFVLSGVPATIFLSLFFVLCLFNHVAHFVGLLSHLDADIVFWFPPSLLPVFAYSQQEQLLSDQTSLALKCGEFICTGVCWGATLVCCATPITLGISIMCVFIAFAINISAAICTRMPLNLGTAAKYLPAKVFADAAILARGDFINKLETETSHEACCGGWDNTSWLQPELCTLKCPCAYTLAVKVDTTKQALRVFRSENLPPTLRADALYTDLDGIAEVCTSRGPFGYLGVVANLFQVAPICLSFWSLDHEGKRANLHDVGKMEASLAITRLHEFETALHHRLEHELEALACFHLLVLATTEMFFARETDLLHDFLSEKHFKLISSGIATPGEIQFPTLNVQLAACWLGSVRDDQRERFHLLYENFKAEQADRDAKIVHRNMNESVAATQLALERLEREREMCSLSSKECSLKRSRRIETWTATLSPEEHDHFFDKLEKEWSVGSPCFVNPKDKALRQSYETNVLLNNNEVDGNCRERLAELEAGERDCVPSKTRVGALQFVDPKFQGPDALGACSGAKFVGAWEHALSVNPHAALFAEGSDPDDVHPGACIDDTWFLAVLSMLSASGGINPDGADIHIRRLFISMLDTEGSLVYDSAVGAFGLKLYVNGQWEAMVVDDMFPMLGDGTIQGGVDVLIELDAHQAEGVSTLGVHREQKAEVLSSTLLEVYKQRYRDCAGFAISHVGEMAELWVSLLEKGVAKYYGSYAAIETGFVPHGLELLTGSQSECLYIAGISSDTRRRALWGSLLRYHKNEYILGARAMPGEYASSWLQGLGLVFGATYTIYDVVDVIPEGHKLIKLRSPAGSMQIYNGAWSCTSPLWTERLRRKLLWNLEPQTFWMTYDEFCRAFCNLYICHYYSDTSTRWNRFSFAGGWTCNGGSENTAAGLPSRHNPGCEVERNPQYAILVHRPVTLRFIIKQTNVNGHASAELQPIAGYLCRADWHQKGSARHVDRIIKLTNQNIVKTTGRSKREHTIKACVERLGPGAYVVLVATFQAEMQGHFILSLISNHEIEACQIWPPFWRSSEYDNQYI
mmetsp:Transcript_22905/g.68754  ORF Transcript_22905/g.68754 Transcript_22905/m.68754 type:complete len:2404 (+) Transcript_22905:58-7269(+)